MNRIESIKRNLRFSVRELLLIGVIIGLATANAIEYAKVRKLEADLRRIEFAKSHRADDGWRIYIKPKQSAAPGPDGEGSETD